MNYKHRQNVIELIVKLILDLIYLIRKIKVVVGMTSKGWFIWFLTMLAFEKTISVTLRRNYKNLCS